MKIIFWGVRGSIPSPGPDTVRYGGNTTCIEVIADDGCRIILDAGSGIRCLGLKLMQQLPVDCSVFLSHTHWDHIQGLPFFLPLFVPGNRVNIYGAFDPVYAMELRQVLARQMEYCYFPVREKELKATIEYTSLREGQEIIIGATKVSNILTNHPVLNFGYKVESNGKKFFFTGDFEPLHNVYPEDDESYQEYERLIQEQTQRFVEFFQGADVLIADSNYTTEEYATKHGWGHSTFENSMSLADKANVKQLYFTHHDTTRKDEELDDIMQQLQESKTIPANLEVLMAREGLEIDL